MSDQGNLTPANNPTVATVDSSTTLYGKTAIVTTGMLSLGAFGAWLTPSLPQWTLFTLSIVWLLFTIVVVGQAVILSLSGKVFGQGVGPVAAGVSTALWSLLSGIVSGPMLHMYYENLGQSVVFSTFLGCCLSAGIAGFIGMMINTNLRKLGTVLSLALWGLIIASLVGAFVTFTPAGEMWFSGIGMVVFFGYFVYDFNRLKNLQKAGANDWGIAIIMGMQLYLDLINLFIMALKWKNALKR